MTFGVNDGSLTIQNGSTSKASESHKKPSSILHPNLVIRSKDEIPSPESLDLGEELPGWHGYIEWEQYPERKKRVKEFMKKFDFPGVSLPFILHSVQAIRLNPF